MKRKVSLSAPAKINLFLEVTGRRADGYHTLATIFAKVALADRVILRRTVAPGVSLRLINKSGCALSSGEDNLVCRAARGVLQAWNLPGGVAITLEKRIPIGAGLGGGSSDAGAVLRGMCELFGLCSAPWRSRKLRALAARLGADVPVFLYRETFLEGRGIGDRLTPLRVPGKLPLILLVYPGVAVPTVGVYKRLKLPERKGLLTNLRALSKLKVMLRGGASIQCWNSLLYNRLEQAVVPFCRPVRRARVQLAAAGAEAVLMSGSGSCVFALCSSPSRARRLAALAAGQDGATVHLTHFQRGEYEHQRDSHSCHERGAP